MIIRYGDTELLGDEVEVRLDRELKVDVEECCGEECYLEWRGIMWNGIAQHVTDTYWQIIDRLVNDMFQEYKWAHAK